jgi:hypothetical protein
MLPPRAVLGRDGAGVRGDAGVRAAAGLDDVGRDGVALVLVAGDGGVRGGGVTGSGIVETGSVDRRVGVVVVDGVFGDACATEAAVEAVVGAAATAVDGTGVTTDGGGLTAGVLAAAAAAGHCRA